MVNRSLFFLLCMFVVGMAGCHSSPDGKKLLPSGREEVDSIVSVADSIPAPKKILTASDISLTKDLLYDKYTLGDVYPYKDTIRSFKWELVCQYLAFIENIQLDSHARWGVLQNYKNQNREAPLVHRFVRNAYGRVSDTLGVERYQSVPLYAPSDTLVPLRYGRDGTLVHWLGEQGNFVRFIPVGLSEEWLSPSRYVLSLADSTHFHHVILIDRRDQHIATLERIEKGIWYIRSMNPATTGRHAPPYAQETPLGIYVLQQKKTKMVFLKDGSKATGGYAPYASRFTNGAYIHGVPVNVPRTSMIEYSWSLGTIPRSHMCVRNASSHAKFIFEWAPTLQTLILVIE